MSIIRERLERLHERLTWLCRYASYYVSAKYLLSLVTSRTLANLLVIWVTAYVIIATLLACSYMGLGCINHVNPTKSEYSLIPLLYFSFLTQATVSFGDFAPVGACRGLSVVQTFVGPAMSSTFLGIVLFKLLKRPNPMVFPRHLMYDMTQHNFWFRFMNVSHDTLREVKFGTYLIMRMGAREANLRNTYDTISSTVKIPFRYHPSRPSLDLTAVRTASNDGTTDERLVKHAGDYQEVTLSPLHFISDFPDTNIHVDLEISGYFGTTGDQFFATQSYDLKTIRCGVYEDVNNPSYDTRSMPDKKADLMVKLDQFWSTSSEQCLICSLYSKCPLDVATATRAGHANVA